ncbi:MAG TPA: glycerophosphodiester phosphodiesterase family protein, partial [Candidatus Binatus sp.]|nr:glycerophosphodiester phosphodiesterase family protein [Candidatus Binatus sp.]
ELVTRESAAFAHDAGIEMHVFTVNEEAEMRQLLDYGVDGLITDYPRRALEVVQKRASAQH